MSPPTFWTQIALLAAVVALIHMRHTSGDGWQWPRTWFEWREILASIVLCALLFSAVSGGRGCSEPSALAQEGVEDAPDPMRRGGTQ